MINLMLDLKQKSSKLMNKVTNKIKGHEVFNNL